MSCRLVVGILGGVACWLVVGVSHAQCSKDTDCKGERVCEQGSCVSPPAPTAGVAIAAAPSAAPASSLAEPRLIATTESTSTYDDEPVERPRRAKRNWKRNSTGMMAGGIVMVAAAPVSLLVALVATLQKDACERRGTYNLQTSTYSGDNCDRYTGTAYGGFVLGLGLLGAGIPLIVVGGKRKPLGTAGIAPWATPDGGGLRLRFDL